MSTTPKQIKKKQTAPGAPKRPRSCSAEINVICATPESTYAPKRPATPTPEQWTTPTKRVCRPIPQRCINDQAVLQLQEMLAFCTSNRINEMQIELKTDTVTKSIYINRV